MTGQSEDSSVTGFLQLLRLGPTMAPSSPGAPSIPTVKSTTLTQSTQLWSPTDPTTPPVLPEPQLSRRWEYC